MSVYLYSKGIEHAASKMKGNELIHMGIRPYEMHAGNTLALVAYPILLCEKLVAQGKEPALTFIVSLNDWEQANLIGQDIYKYNFYVMPENSTIQFTVESNGDYTADLWGRRIVVALEDIKKLYPKVTIKPVYNSDLKEHSSMKQVVLKTITHRQELKNLMIKSSGRPTINSELPFASAICPACHHANTDTNVLDNEILTTNCQQCGATFTRPYEDFMYWLYHKPLFAARWKVFGFTHSISGGDHFHEGDVDTRKALYQFFFNQKAPELEMIFSPILIGDNGQKMSKSRNNFFTIPLETITKAARNHDAQHLTVL